ncbi:MAG: UDP-N-acetylglucosamine 2-epimerase (hydrolyzing) [Acetobacter sp.]|nr:UDP-N-acetylglucosamine 2-epimerase (hydrolyzing) [Acetobacter sp.]
MYKIAFVTGSRADYGIVRSYLSMLHADKDIDFSLLLTGAALDNKYGNLKDIISSDQFRIDYTAPLPLETNSIANTIHAMAVALELFGKYFEASRYDLLIILGDRYEIFSVAIAAAMHGIRILHLHGGEITYANYDEFMRHSITKMSWYHITSTEIYRKRVIQLGELPTHVICGGALGAENCLTIDINHVPRDLQSLVGQDYFVILFHPETLNTISPHSQIKELLNGLKCLPVSIRYVFIGSNADTGSDEIEMEIKRFCEAHKNCIRYQNLHPDAYHFLVKNSLALVGNSSSGIIEAPSLGVRTVNIGLRQEGRVYGNSVINVPCDRTAVYNALKEAIENRKHYDPSDNPYYRKNSCQIYYEFTKKILSQNTSHFAKIFYDIEFDER